MPWRKTRPGGGYKSLVFSELIDFGGYDEWRNGFVAGPPFGRKEAPFNSLPVYGAAWRLAVEATEMAARLERNYRYSLGEDIRLGVKRAVLCITLAGKGENRQENVRSARLAMLDVELSLRLLSDLKILPDKRYVYFLEMVEDIIRQLSNWERSLSKQISPPKHPKNRCFLGTPPECLHRRNRCLRQSAE